jgi:hypothetical protein
VLGIFFVSTLVKVTARNSWRAQKNCPFGTFWRSAPKYGDKVTNFFTIGNNKSDTNGDNFGALCQNQIVPIGQLLCGEFVTRFGKGGLSITKRPDPAKSEMRSFL